MKLKLKKQAVRKLPAPATVGNTRNEGNKKFQALSDDYEPVVLKEKRVLVKEYQTDKGGNTKVYINVKVQRYDKEDGANLGLPHVFIQMYQECEKPEGYTGYLKGKSVHFPLDMMCDMLDTLTDVSSECNSMKLE